MQYQQNATILHYTLSTADTRISTRKEVGDDIIALLQPIMPNGGQIPRTPGFTVDIAQSRGCAMFTIKRDMMQVIECGVAWTKEGDAEVWPHLEDLYLRFYGNKREVARKPATYPWLGVIILPGMKFLPLTGC